MKDALQDLDSYDSYRSGESDRIQEAVEKYSIPVAGKRVVDFGCYDGAISAEYIRQGAGQITSFGLFEQRKKNRKLGLGT